MLIQQVWLSLLPRAIELISRELGEPRTTLPQLTWLAPALKRAYPAEGGGADSVEIRSALASAVTEFLRWRESTELGDPPAEEELAFHLIRIAYNRWQRRDRSDRVIRRAAEANLAPGDGDGTPLLESLPATDLGNSENLARQLSVLVDEMLGSLSSRDRAIVRAYLERTPKSEIARVLGCHRATVARVVALFRDNFASLARRELD
jgi:DNA-directed RNA polymerase specialized sigma24 family protein